MGTYNIDNIMSILEEMNPKYCDCQIGGAGKTLGYLCPGTCLDYAYDKLKIPYSVAWEIWDMSAMVPSMTSPVDNSFLQVKSRSYTRSHAH